MTQPPLLSRRHRPHSARDGNVLFASRGNTNHVVALDLASKQQLENIQIALGPKAPPGSTSNSLAMSPDAKTVYVANADNNTVAVIDVEDRGKREVEGFIPTGWYPTLVRVTRDGKRILIGSGKGVGAGPNKVKRPVDGIAPAVSFQAPTSSASMSTAPCTRRCRCSAPLSCFSACRR